MTMPATKTAVRPGFLRLIESELDQMERVLSTELSSTVETVTSVSRHTLEAGGKRLRPSLALLSARACQSNIDPDTLVEVAASMELIHMATLMHDDVIDGADSRRGRVTANLHWGNRISVLTGDYILARAFSLLARNGNMRVMQALSNAAAAMTEGEITQLESRYMPDAHPDTYLSIIHDKTAVFMSACCESGAILAGDSPAFVNALSGYGLNLGLAFQITDDLLDLIGDPAQTGKPLGADIREGKVTMPVILARDNADDASRTKLSGIITNANQIGAAEIEFVRELVQETEAAEGTREVAAELIRKAIEQLHDIPASEARDGLEELARSILHRKC
jgi:octaprenyl-diphosphate synthase